MKPWIWAICVAASLAGCASQSAEQSRQLGELDRRVRTLEADRSADREQIRVLQSKLQLAESDRAAPAGEAAQRTPLLRVVRLEPSAPEAAQSAPADDDSAAEHVVLSGSGTQLVAETRKEGSAPGNNVKAPAASKAQVKP